MTLLYEKERKYKERIKQLEEERHQILHEIKVLSAELESLKTTLRLCHDMAKSDTTGCVSCRRVFERAGEALKKLRE